MISLRAPVSVLCLLRLAVHLHSLLSGGLRTAEGRAGHPRPPGNFSKVVAHEEWQTKHRKSNESLVGCLARVGQLELWNDSQGAQWILT